MKNMCIAILPLIAVAAMTATAQSRCEWCDTQMLVPHGDPSEMDSSAVYWTQGEAETNKIDVLLVFDKTARDWALANGYASCEEFADEAVLEMNAALANTGLDEFFTFRLAGAKVAGVSFNNYTASSLAYKFGTQLGLKSSEIPVIQKIRKARDDERADLVALISDGFKGDAYGSGIMLASGYWNESGLEEYKDMSYCAVSISAIQERYTLLHELGHLMGAGHADTVAYGLYPGPQVFDYSAGYYFSVGGTRYATVMSSELDGYADKRAERLPFFSSPEFTMLAENEHGQLVDSGVAVGTSLNDNTRTLRNTYSIVANFRVAKQLDILPNDPRAIKLSARTPDGAFADGATLPTVVGLLTRLKVEADSSLATTFSASGLPSGMSINTSTGLIGGSALATGVYDVVVTAKNEVCSQTFAFKLDVAELPEWASGTYYGWTDWDNVPVKAKIIVKPSGKMKGAFNVAGKNRFFTASRFSRAETGEDGEMEFSADVKVAVSASETRPLTLRFVARDFADRSGESLKKGEISFDGMACGISEDLWNESGFSTAKVAKNRIVSATVAGGLDKGDALKFMLTTNGAGKFTGRVSGVKISGSSQFERLGVEEGSDRIEIARMPVIVSPKAGSALRGGYARMARFRVAFNNSTGKVAGLKFVALEPL